MRKVLPVLALLAVLLLTAGLLPALRRDAAQLPDASSAALGMMLLEQEQGLYVLAVTQDSAADRADIRPGDCLVKVGEEWISAVARLDMLIEAAPEALEMMLLRDGREVPVRLQVR